MSDQYCHICKINSIPVSGMRIAQHFVTECNICNICKESYCYQQSHRCKKDYDICEFCNITFAKESDFDEHNKKNLYKHLNLMYNEIKENTKRIELLEKAKKNH